MIGIKKRGSPSLSTREIEALFFNVPPTEGFMSRLQKGEGDGCWRWIARIDKDGYGFITKKNRRVLAHRLSFIMNGGVLTPEKPMVLHSCNNRFCVNPAHLYAGDQFDNERDKLAAGTYLCGSRVTVSKLTEESVAEIKRKLSQNKDTITAIAEQFGVRRQTISKINKGLLWKHVQI